MNIELAKTFLSKIWADIKYWFEKLPVELQEAAQLAVSITEAIKRFDDKDPEVADIITAIIPGGIDDIILSWLRINIPIILTELRLISSSKTLSDPNEITKAAIQTIQQVDGDVKSAFLHDIGVMIAQQIAKAKNKKLDWGDAVYIVEWYYQHKFKPA